MNNKKNNKDFIEKILQELEQEEEDSRMKDEELAYELELLSKGVRTKPVFYD